MAIDARLQEDIDFIENPHKWAGGREKVCCLKRYGDESLTKKHTGKEVNTTNGGPCDFGFLLSITGVPTYTVFLGNLHAQEIHGKIEYNSAQEIIDAGWIVD